MAHMWSYYLPNLQMILKKCSLENVLHMNISIILITIFGMISVVIWRTMEIGFRTPQACESVESDGKEIIPDESIVSRFQKAVQFKTISTQPGEFTKMIKFIQDSFKSIHKSRYVTMEIISDFSLLYKITGSDKSLTPYLILGHLDVVSAEPNLWVLPPFAGKLKDGYICGRGTMDFKNGVMGILEALEYLLSAGFKPKRTFYISFGHDKEQGGTKGAADVSKLLQARGLEKLEFILDQGCSVTGEINGIAVIGTTEKTVLDLTLTAKSPGGHSALSHPNVISPIRLLANAITKIENNSHPSMLGKGPEKYMLEKLAPVMNIWYKILWSNIWLFKPIISKMMSYNQNMNAKIRTVHTITDIHTEYEEEEINDIPETVTARIKVYVHPAETVSDVLFHFRKVINDPKVQITTTHTSRIASMSPYGEEDFGYQTVCRSIQQVFKPFLIAPGIMASWTDSSRYHMFTNNIYRFSPILYTQGDEQRIHGKNERLSVKDYGNAINFYKHVMLNADKSCL